MLISFNEKKTEANKLGSQVERFWDLHTIGIKYREISVYDKLLDDVKFVSGRYEVRLPFKEDHPLIEDNYALAVARLKELKGRLDRRPNSIRRNHAESIKVGYYREGGEQTYGWRSYVLTA